MKAHTILSKLLVSYENHSQYHNGHCGEFAYATMILLDYFGYHGALCTTYNDDNSMEDPTHSFIYCDDGWYGWYFDHDHLTESEIEFFELDENLLDPEGNYEGDYPNLDMDQDYESFCWDCRNYVCFCWECIENLLKEFEEVFNIKINNEIVEKHRDEIYNYILVTH